jgi:tetratricopeptide (TPR) repeat protein
MGLPELEYDLSTVLDENLREKPANFEDMQKAVAEYKEHAEGLGDSEKDDLEKANAYTLIGLYSRILLALEDSEDFLKKAFELFKKHEKATSAQMTKVRLATTLAWASNYTKSDEYFSGAIDKFRDAKGSKSQVILGYSLENYGKSKLERQMVQDALDLFLEALEVKMALGKMDDIQNLNDFIATARGKLESPEESEGE